MIEMMGVALLIGIFSMVAVSGYRAISNNVRRNALDDRFLITATAIRLYQIDRGDFPSNLTSLLELSVSGVSYMPEVPADPYAKDSNATLGWNSSTGTLRSVGPDGKTGTADDICFVVGTSNEGGPC